MWDNLEDNINNILNYMCPLRDLIVPETKPDWLTNDIVQLMRRRDKMYKEARRKKDPISWRKAIFLRNRVEMTIKNHKREKIKSELERTKDNPKKFWENINSLIGKKDKICLQQLHSEDGEKSYEGTELAVHINNYFAEIGSKLANDIKDLCGIVPEQGFINGSLNNGSDYITNNEITTIDLERFFKESQY